MSNRFREEILEDEAEKVLVVEEKPKRELPNNFFMQFLRHGVITTDDATRALPFVLYIAFLCMLYIGNRHISDNTIRDIDKIGKEVKELSWDYKNTKAELAFKSTLSQVAAKVKADSMDIKISEQPAQRIVVKEDAQ
ncbi:hypothetical protein A0256_10680 [Mucilaginibacter sp. PAMC 26640]|nr:hypothetical protein A0256_10680 [Mucilaginibacter sp. PAMC 26640]